MGLYESAIEDYQAVLTTFKRLELSNSDINNLSDLNWKVKQSVMEIQCLLKWNFLSLSQRITTRLDLSNNSLVTFRQRKWQSLLA